MQLSAEAVMTWSEETASALCNRDAEFGAMVKESSLRHMRRLYEGVSNSLATSSYHLDIINNLQRINTMISCVAVDIVAAAREEREEAKEEARATEKRTRAPEQADSDSDRT